LEGGTVARRVRHWRLLAEPDPPPKRLTVWEERAALRALLDLPPSREGLKEPGPNATKLGANSYYIDV
jgi:hypothetical protein